MLKGFKDFISRGNAVDLAVGVVIGSAFGMLVTSIVDNFISPLIAMVFGQPNFDNVFAFQINYAQFSLGAIFTDLLNFVLVAVAVYFCVVLPMNKLASMRKKDEVAEESGPSEIELLTQIRDSLKK